MSSAKLVPGDKAGVLLLSGELDFQTVSGLRHALQPYLRKGKRLAIDMSNVQHTNSAALALLLQWLEDALDADSRLDYVNLPGELVDIAELHGLKGLLPLASAAKSA